MSEPYRSFQPISEDSIPKIDANEEERKFWDECFLKWLDSITTGGESAAKLADYCLKQRRLRFGIKPIKDHNPKY